MTLAPLHSGDRAHKELSARDPKLSDVPMISIVDDDAWAREGIKDLVLSLGYQAVTFESAEHFMNSSHIERTACVITDVEMPGVSGLDLQDHLLARGHRMPVILITAYPDERHRSRALGAGAVGFLSKPFDEQVLIDCLARAIGAAN
jgi:FixJ family two-component response regulator